MNPEHRHTEILTKYLLKDLPEPEMESLEEKYFTDDGLFGELLETENRLIFDYLHGRLRSREKELFEQRYLSTPSGRQKVELAYLLPRSEAAKSILKKRGSERLSYSYFPIPSLLLHLGGFKSAVWVPSVVVLLILVTIGVFLMRRPPANDQAVRDSQPATDISRGTSPPVSSLNQGDQIARVELAPSVDIRSETASNPTLRVGKKTRLIELKLKLIAPIHSKYQGQVLNKEEHMTKVVSDQSLIPEGDLNEKYVLWRIDANVLPVGDYQVELRSVNANGETGDVNAYDLKVRD